MNHEKINVVIEGIARNIEAKRYSLLVWPIIAVVFVIGITLLLPKEGISSYFYGVLAATAALIGSYYVVAQVYVGFYQKELGLLMQEFFVNPKHYPNKGVGYHTAKDSGLFFTTSGFSEGNLFVGTLNQVELRFSELAIWRPQLPDSKIEHTTNFSGVLLVADFSDLLASLSKHQQTQLTRRASKRLRNLLDQSDLDARAVIKGSYLYLRIAGPLFPKCSLLEDFDIDWTPSRLRLFAQIVDDAF